jgi:cytochrome P450
MEYFTEVMQTTTASLVDVYPVLRYLPHFMQPTLKAASNWHKEETKFYLRLWNDVKEKIAQGTANPCFTADLLQAQKEEAFPDKFGAYLAGGSLEAGTDTTSNTLYGFVQAMVLFPDVQKAAQAELDRVVGGRLPVMEDLPELRYIRSCVKESLRWMPTAITGAAPHAAKQDIQFMGYVIPKGSLIVNNVYTIHNDPKRYPNPKKFDPARYLNDTQTASEAALNSDVSKRDHFTFGAGRRLCAGMHVAEQSLFLGISHILWAFDIRPAKDENTGKDLLPDQDKYTEANVCMPAPYSAIITPRSEQKAEKIREEWHKAQNELTEQGQWKQIPQGMKFNAI